MERVHTENSLSCQQKYERQQKKVEFMYLSRLVEAIRELEMKGAFTKQKTADSSENSPFYEEKKAERMYNQVRSFMSTKQKTIDQVFATLNDLNQINYSESQKTIQRTQGSVVNPTNPADQAKSANSAHSANIVKFPHRMRQAGSEKHLLYFNQHQESARNASHNDSNGDNIQLEDKPEIQLKKDQQINCEIATSSVKHSSFKNIFRQLEASLIELRQSAKLKERNNELAKKLLSVSGEAKKFESENRELKEIMKSDSKEQNSSKRLSTKNSRLCDQIIELKQMNLSLKRQIKELKDELTYRDEELLEMKNDQDRFGMGQFEKRKPSLDNAKEVEDIERISREKLSLEEDLHILGKQNERLSGELSEYKETLRDFSCQFDHLEKDNESVRSQLRAAKNQLLLRQKESLEAQADRTVEEALRCQNEESRHKISILAKKNFDLENQFQELLKAKLDIEGDLSELQAEILSSENKCVDYEKRIQESLLEIKEKEQLQQQQDRVKLFKVEQVKDKIEQSKKSYENLRGDMEKMLREFQELMGMIVQQFQDALEQSQRNSSEGQGSHQIEDSNAGRMEVSRSSSETETEMFPQQMNCIAKELSICHLEESNFSYLNTESDLKIKQTEETIRAQVLELENLREQLNAFESNSKQQMAKQTEAKDMLAKQKKKLQTEHEKILSALFEMQQEKFQQEKRQRENLSRLREAELTKLERLAISPQCCLATFPEKVKQQQQYQSVEMQTQEDRISVQKETQTQEYIVKRNQGIKTNIFEVTLQPTLKLDNAVQQIGTSTELVNAHSESIEVQTDLIKADCALNDQRENAQTEYENEMRAEQFQIVNRTFKIDIYEADSQQWNRNFQLVSETFSQKVDQRSQTLQSANNSIGEKQASPKTEELTLGEWFEGQVKNDELEKENQKHSAMQKSYFGGTVKELSFQIVYKDDGSQELLSLREEVKRLKHQVNRLKCQNGSTLRKTQGKAHKAETYCSTFNQYTSQFASSQSAEKTYEHKLQREENIHFSTHQSSGNLVGSLYHEIKFPRLNSVIEEETEESRNVSKTNIISKKDIEDDEFDLCI